MYRRMVKHIANRLVYCTLACLTLHFLSLYSSRQNVRIPKYSSTSDFSLIQEMNPSVVQTCFHHARWVSMQVQTYSACHSTCHIHTLLSACRLVDFVMGLKKLKTLSITLARITGGSDRQGDLSKLQKHPCLQEIRLISNGGQEVIGVFEKSVSVPLTRNLCNFFAAQQLKVLNLMFRTHVEVNIQCFPTTHLLFLVRYAEGWDMSVAP